MAKRIADLENRLLDANGITETKGIQQSLDRATKRQTTIEEAEREDKKAEREDKKAEAEREDKKAEREFQLKKLRLNSNNVSEGPQYTTVFLVSVSCVLCVPRSGILPPTFANFNHGLRRAPCLLTMILASSPLSHTPLPPWPDPPLRPYPRASCPGCVFPCLSACVSLYFFFVSCLVVPSI